MYVLHFEECIYFIFVLNSNGVMIANMFILNIEYQYVFSKRISSASKVLIKKQTDKNHILTEQRISDVHRTKTPRALSKRKSYLPILVTTYSNTNFLPAQTFPQALRRQSCAMHTWIYYHIEKKGVFKICILEFVGAFPSRYSKHSGRGVQKSFE